MAAADHELAAVLGVPPDAVIRARREIPEGAAWSKDEKGRVTWHEQGIALLREHLGLPAQKNEAGRPPAAPESAGEGDPGPDAPAPDGAPVAPPALKDGRIRCRIVRFFPNPLFVAVEYLGRAVEVRVRQRHLLAVGKTLLCRLDGGRLVCAQKENAPLT